MDLASLLSHALTTGTEAAGAYEQGKVNKAAAEQKNTLAMIEQMRRAQEDRDKRALQEAQVGHLNAQTNSLTNPQETWGDYEDVSENGKNLRYQRSNRGNRRLVGDTPVPAQKPEIPPATVSPGQGVRQPDGSYKVIIPKESGSDDRTLVQVQNEDGTVTYVPRSQAAGMQAPRGQGIGSAALRKTVAANRTQLSIIDDALAGVDKRPESFGLKRGVGDMIPFMGNVGDAINQRVDPEGVQYRSPIANVGSMIIHDRSGAAVTVSEYPRLAPFVPRASDTPQAIKDKLTKLKQAIETETALLQEQVGGGTFEGKPAPGAHTGKTTATREQQLWDAAVAKHGKAKVEAEYGPRPD